MAKRTPASLLADFYKIGHRPQYPNNTEYVSATWTPRTSRLDGINEVIAFGFQGFILEFLIDYFNDNFFNRPKDQVIAEYKRIIKHCLHVENPHTKHMEDLHDVGHLPILIKALPEGTRVPIRCPMLTIENTNPDFFWVTNYLETIASCQLWQPTTSITLADQYMKILKKWAKRTVGNTGFVKYQGHDFSMRGMGHLEAAKTSGAGHLASGFVGTDTIPAICYLEDYYGANVETEEVGGSVNATEHSVMMAGGAEKGQEYATYKRLITEVYPDGILSIVSDTWDLWYVLTDTIPKLKNEILARNGKIVIRPDSGDPVDIICGTERIGYHPDEKGVIELLWDTFGGTVNAQGFKELDPHIGAIYGDAITLQRCEDICTRLADKGFASTNIVFGIGSFTYQYNTRDTFGHALKSTHVVIDGIESNIFKDPITDNGVKKSQTGKVVVVKEDGKIVFKDGLTAAEEGWWSGSGKNLLQPIFCNGRAYNLTTLQEVRDRIVNEDC